MAATPESDRSSDTPADISHGAGEVIRSEERLQVGTQVRVSGRAVLRTYVVTEQVTQTFEVRREEVRLEQLPAGGEDVGVAGARDPFSNDVALELVLHREVPEVVMRVVATERVRLHVDTVTSEVVVTDQVRREQVALDPVTPVDRV